MSLHNRKRSQKPKWLYTRATVVVVNQEGHVLIVKHNRQRDWALPGGQIRAAEEPSRRAVLEVAEETGLAIRDVEFVGRYAGSVASHQVFVAKAQGSPVPNRRELQEAIWWDRKSRLDVQQHVSAILAIASDRIRQGKAEPSAPPY